MNLDSLIYLIIAVIVIIIVLVVLLHVMDRFLFILPLNTAPEVGLIHADYGHFKEIMSARLF
jgi:TRAP-type C4-dicarboxylate transport system permease small subunit